MGKDYLKRRDHWNGQLFFMDTKFKLQYDNLFCVSTGHSATVAITWSAISQLLTGPVFMWPADPLPSQLFTGLVLTSPADQLSVSRSLGQCSRDQLISYQVSCSLAQCSGDQLISYQVSCSLGQCSCDQLISYQVSCSLGQCSCDQLISYQSAVHWVSVHVTNWSAIRQLFTGPVFRWPADQLPGQLFTGPVFMWPTDQPSVSCSLGQPYVTSWSFSKIWQPMDGIWHQVVKTVSFWSCNERLPFRIGDRAVGDRAPSLRRGKLPPLPPLGVARRGGVPLSGPEVRERREVLPTRLSDVPRRSTTIELRTVW